MDPDYPLRVARDIFSKYYPLFKTNRSALADIYRDDSVLMWEGASFTGTSITNKLASLPLSNIEVSLESMVAQHSPSMGIFVTAVGSLVINNEPRARKFLHAVVLGRHYECFYILREIFSFVPQA